MDKKTNRKNQTNLQVNWPSENEYWTVTELWKRNPQFEALITLRVRLANAIKKSGTVSAIGELMGTKGRPQMVFAVKQKDGTVKKSTIEAAKKAGIRCGEPQIVTVAKAMPQNVSSLPAVPSINLNPAPETLVNQ